MNEGYIMTWNMLPLSEKQEILKEIYFNNPRTTEEVEHIAQILKKANHLFNPIPETTNQLKNKDNTISLEMIKKEFYNKYQKEFIVTKRKKRE